MCNLYIIRNEKNPKKVYIGITSYENIQKRLWMHIAEANRGNKRKLCAAIRKYGKESFSIELLKVIPIEKALEIEANYIKKYDSFQNGYNSNPGGYGCLFHTEETKRKMSLNSPRYNKGKIRTAEHCKNLSDSKKGKISWTKTWKITFPDGTIEISTNMAEFCRIHNLHRGNMSSVAKGTLKHYKGFKISQLNK